LYASPARASATSPSASAVLSHLTVVPWKTTLAMIVQTLTIATMP
jgi:hypothetical protein